MSSCSTATGCTRRCRHLGCIGTPPRHLPTGGPRRGPRAGGVGKYGGDIQERSGRSSRAVGRDDRRRQLLPQGRYLRGNDGPKNTPYRVAGMQQAVTVIRKAGYDGIMAIPGIAYANDLSQWLSHMPRDPLHQLIAEAHVYGEQVWDDVRRHMRNRSRWMRRRRTRSRSGACDSRGDDRSRRCAPCAGAKREGAPHVRRTSPEWSSSAS